MIIRAPRSTAALPPEQAAPLRRALDGSADVTVFVDGTAHRLPGEAQAAVVDLLARLSDGDAVQVTSVAELLTTSQAAELAGISHSYLRKLTDAGTLPVEYRGSHRRLRRADVEDWLRSQLRRSDPSGPTPAASGPPATERGEA
ncbi:helix-turn-helix domain-containing protein [Arthrobacter pityocampae]|uniref:helix-turn-helix domain-containing protein n=1 Tax=Arthrobacter pityocampae TaxID=547334 RepID=UPI003736690D